VRGAAEAARLLNLEAHLSAIIAPQASVLPRNEAPHTKQVWWEPTLQRSRPRDGIASAVITKPPKRIGPYRVLKRAGKGGMGVVYQAMQSGTARRVALKTVRVSDASMVGSMRREIRGLSNLRHPGIVRIVDQGMHEGLPWYAMDLMEGTTLRDYITGLSVGEADAEGTDALRGCARHRPGSR